MLRRALIVAILSLWALSSAQLVLHAASAATPAPDAVAENDQVGDETLDLAEVKLAASARFDKLDKDSNGSLDAGEVQGLIGKKDFKAADSDHDGTLSKQEYLALVEKLFKKADVDHDGTLSVQELRSPAARTLKPLLD
jgi:Ca2+-binding EF-hand superfamily protein